MKSLTIKFIIAIGILLMAAPESIMAQYNFSFQDSLGSYKVEFTPHKSDKSDAYRMNKPVSIGAHEIRLGLSFCAATPTGYTTDNWWDPRDYNMPSIISIASERWFTVNAEGGKWFKEWFYFGGAFVWTGGFAKAHNYATHDKIKTYNYNAFTLMPTIRFAWLRRGIVQLYSGLGLGAVVANRETYDSKYTMLDISYDVTFIGISVGRDLFGYFDIGAGHRGVISAGIGYRFNKK